MTARVYALAAAPAPSFVECHSEGHQWRHLPGVAVPADWRPPYGMPRTVARYSTCTDCGTERARWYSRAGEVVTRYRYPDGYLHDRAATDTAAPSRQDWRARLVADLFDVDEGRPRSPRIAAKASR